MDITFFMTYTRLSFGVSWPLSTVLPHVRVELDNHRTLAEMLGPGCFL